MEKNKSRRHSLSDIVIAVLLYLFLAVAGLACVLPMWHVLMGSLSETMKFGTYEGFLLFPIAGKFTFESYTYLFTHQYLWRSIANAVIYTVSSVALGLIMSIMAAYALTRKNVLFKRPLMIIILITMFFNGGMVPTYMLISQLKLIDNPLVMILPGMIGVYNMILARTFMQNLPYELFEAAEIDGCSDAYYFWRMVLPLSKACIAVIALYYAVGHWNAYFNAFLYLNDRNKYPLSLFLREILINNQMNESMDIDPELLERKQGLADVLKYSLILVSTVPVLCVYPFAQKYFVHGVMIGSLKG